MKRAFYLSFLSVHRRQVFIPLLKVAPKLIVIANFSKSLLKTQRLFSVDAELGTRGERFEKFCNRLITIWGGNDFSLGQLPFSRPARPKSWKFAFLLALFISDAIKKRLLVLIFSDKHFVNTFRVQLSARDGWLDVAFPS